MKKIIIGLAVAGLLTGCAALEDQLNTLAQQGQQSQNTPPNQTPVIQGCNITANQAMDWLHHDSDGKLSCNNWLKFWYYQCKTNNSLCKSARSYCGRASDFTKTGQNCMWFYDSAQRADSENMLHH